MNIKIVEDQIESLKKGIMTKILVPKNDYEIGGKVHLSIGFFKNYKKIAVKECKSVSIVIIEPKHSSNAAIIEVDYLMLSTREKKQFAIDCGFTDLETFLKHYNDKKDYSLINFK